MKFRLCLFFLLGLGSCATLPKSIPPSLYLFQSGKAVHQIYQDLEQKLKSENYRVRNFDTTIGLITTQPKRVSLARSSEHYQGDLYESLEVVQIGGSVKIRFNYSCDYKRNDPKDEISQVSEAVLLENMNDCYNNDQDVLGYVQENEQKMLALIQNAL